MSTRAQIVIEDLQTIKLYKHSDGYPSGVLPVALVEELVDPWERVLATPRLYRWLDPLRGDRVTVEWAGQRFRIPLVTVCDLVGELPEVAPFDHEVPRLSRWEQGRWPLEEVLRALEGEGMARRSNGG